MLRRLAVIVLSLTTFVALAASGPVDDDDPDPKTLERLVERLGSTDFRQREAAMKALRKIGDLAIPYLERQQNSPDLELRNRVRELLANIKVTGEVFCFGGHGKHHQCRAFPLSPPRQPARIA